MGSDKLLGKESKDIDIALDNMLGKEFADKVVTLASYAVLQQLWPCCTWQTEIFALVWHLRKASTSASWVPDVQLLPAHAGWNMLNSVDTPCRVTA